MPEITKEVSIVLRMDDIHLLKAVASDMDITSSQLLYAMIYNDLYFLRLDIFDDAKKEDPFVKYHALYSHWLVAHRLMPNNVREKHDTRVTDVAIDMYGIDTITTAIDWYAEVLKNPDYVEVPKVPFEVFLLETIKDFLPDSKQSPFVKFLSPMIKENVKRKIRLKEKAKKRRIHAKDIKQRRTASRLQMINKFRKRRGYEPITMWSYLRRTKLIETKIEDMKVERGSK